MNRLIRLWNVIAGLADSLTRTKELIDIANGRAEHSLGIDEPQLKIIEAPKKQKAEKSV